MHPYLSNLQGAALFQTLEWLGGGFFLLNKIFLSCSEHATYTGNMPLWRRWRIASWVAYMIGLPMIVAVFANQHDYIVAFVEASGFPAMILGLLMSLKGVASYRAPRLLQSAALLCTVAGIVVSFYHFKTLTKPTQLLEIILTIGYLIGTLQLAHNRRSGYLWFVVMHLSCGWLAFVQGMMVLFWLQIASLGFIAHAYLMSRQQSSFVSERNQAVS